MLIFYAVITCIFYQCIVFIGDTYKMIEQKMNYDLLLFLFKICKFNISR